MKKILLLAAVCCMALACEKKEPDNELVGTHWKTPSSVHNSFYGGNWFWVYDFISNTTYDTYFYDEKSGDYASVEEGLRYEFKDPYVYCYGADGSLEQKFELKNSREMVNESGYTTWSKFGGYE